MSDLRRDDDWRPPVANGADAWGEPEPDVPPIPVTDAPTRAVGDADPVWAVPGRESTAEPVAPAPEHAEGPEVCCGKWPRAVWLVVAVVVGG